MGAMDDTRLWVGGGAVAALVVLGAGYAGLVGPERATITSQQADTDTARSANDALQVKLTALKRQSRDMTALTSQLRTVRTQLPIYGGIPAYFTQLSTKAGTAHVGITSLSVGSVAAAAGASATTATTTDTTASTDTAAATPTPTPTATTSTSTTDTTTTDTTAATAAVGPAGQLFQIGLTVVSTGALSRQEAFLEALQKPGGRAALVTAVQLAPGQSSESTSITGATTLTTTLTIYVAPQTPAAAALLAKQLTLRSTK